MPRSIYPTKEKTMKEPLKTPQKISEIDEESHLDTTDWDPDPFDLHNGEKGAAKKQQKRTRQRIIGEWRCIWSQWVFESKHTHNSIDHRQPDRRAWSRWRRAVAVLRRFSPSGTMPEKWVKGHSGWSWSWVRPLLRWSEKRRGSREWNLNVGVCSNMKEVNCEK